MDLSQATPAPGSKEGLPTPPTEPQYVSTPGMPVNKTPPENPVPQASPVPQAPPAPPEPPAPTQVPPVQEFTPFLKEERQLQQVHDLLKSKKVPDADTILNNVKIAGELSIQAKAQLLQSLGNDLGNIVISQLDNTISAVREAGVNEGKRLKEYARNKFQGTDVDKTWAGIKKFVSSKEAGYSTEEIKTLNSLLNQGGTHGELALNEIAHRYESAISYSKEPQLLQGSGGTFSSFEPIDKRKYQAEIRELVNKFGEDSNEVRALRERRLMSIKQGY